MLTQLEDEILALLASGRPEGTSVGEIATQLGRSAPFVSQTLGRMERRRMLDRRTISIPEGRSVLYRLAPWMEVNWVSPSEGVAVHWRAFGEVDWQYPLVSQIPDLPGRTTLANMLAALEQVGALTARPAGSLGGLAIRKTAFSGITVAVHGSVARGTAREGSDVDVLVFYQDSRPEMMERIHATIDEASVRSPRPIQVALFHWGGEFDKLPATLRGSLKESGLVVFDGLRERHGGQTVGIWRHIYGGRRSASA